MVTLNGEQKFLEYSLRINQQIKNPITQIQNNDQIQCDFPSVEVLLNQFDVDYTHVFINEREVSVKTKVSANDSIQTFLDDQKLLSEEANTKDKPLGIDTDFYVTINNERVSLKGKKTYVFVDIFDVYPFDRTKARGTLITKINGFECSYLDPIHNNDVIDLYWEELATN